MFLPALTSEGVKLVFSYTCQLSPTLYHKVQVSFPHDYCINTLGIDAIPGTIIIASSRQLDTKNHVHFGAVTFSLKLIRHGLVKILFPKS